MIDGHSPLRRGKTEERSVIESDPAFHLVSLSGQNYTQITQITIEGATRIENRAYFAEYRMNCPINQTLRAYERGFLHAEASVYTLRRRLFTLARRPQGHRSRQPFYPRCQHGARRKEIHGSLYFRFRQAASHEKKARLSPGDFIDPIARRVFLWLIQGVFEV